MFRKNLMFKNSVVFIWLVSYLVVFAIPVLGSVLMFFGLQNTMLKQTETSNILLLQQSVENLDTLLIETERISAELELNSDIYEYTYLPADREELKLYKMQEIKDSFATSTLNLSRDNISAALYFKDIDMFLTRNSAYTSREYYDCFLDRQQGYEQWHQRLTSAEDSVFFKSRFAFDEENLADAVGYHKQIPYSGNEGQKISLFVTYNMEEYLSFLHQISFAQESAVMITDTGGTELFSFNMEDVPESLRQRYQMFSENGQEIRTGSGNGYSVISIASETSGWRYMYFIPTKAYLLEYRQIFGVFVIGMLGVLLFGMAVIAFLIRKNYLPVQTLLTEYNIEKESSKNEFILIKELISKNMEEKMQLVSTLDKQKSIVQKSYLTKLLTGEIKKGTDISEILQEIDVGFCPDWAYLVIIISIDSTDDFFEGETRMGAFERKQLVNFMFENVLGELTEKSYTGYTLPYEDSLFCIVGAETVREETVSEMIEYAQKVFDTNFSILFSAAVSKVNYGYDGIAEGYRQAIEAMEYRALSDEGSITLYSEVAKKESHSVDVIELDEGFLSGLLENGNAESAKQYLRNIFQQQVYEEKISTRQLRCLLYEVTNAFLRSITNIYRSDAKAALLQEELVAAMENKLSVEKYCKVFCDLADSICEDTGNTLQNKNIASRMKEYVQDHYSDPDLNISMLAEVFHLSSGYISNMFKKEENIGILDFIGLTRVSKAKELLRETCMTLEDIYLQVGFTNKSTFIRVFKNKPG